MKKTRYLLFFILILLSISVLFSCDLSQFLPPEDDGELDGRDRQFTVEYEYNNGEDRETVSVWAGAKLEEPEEPTKKNYLFIGWYTDEAFEYPHSFDTEINENLTLYARYMPDYESITNSLMKKEMRANVKVRTVITNYGYMGAPSSTKYATGSGVIFKEDWDSFYVLTNNHVVSATGDIVKYEVYDCYHNCYEAEVLFSDATYDLAVVKFKMGSAKLDVAYFAEDMPGENEYVIAMGQPSGQMNALTFGQIKDFETIELNEKDKKDSNVTFEVLWHSANIYQGSSGGALLNLDFEIVGINFATSYDKDLEFAYGFAVSVDKVTEFLNLYTE